MTRNATLSPAPFVLLVSRHGKARAVAPTLRRAFGARVGIAVGVDTDRVRSDRRASSSLEAALAKIQAGFQSTRYARWAIASAGEFNADPTTQGFLIGSEAVVLADRSSGVFAVGRCEVKRPIDSLQIETMDTAIGFAASLGFPRRSVRLLTPCGQNGRDIDKPDDLAEAIQSALLHQGFVEFENDMRAHRCSWRMDAIRHATENLVESLASKSLPIG